ncbi:hypothetical protein Misp03_70430 [Microbispora sp. NBRC 16548]|nr:hypothetical protein Misp03_70430 [Microbispora sp. NBRC 16548]
MVRATAAPTANFPVTFTVITMVLSRVVTTSTAPAWRVALVNHLEIVVAPILASTAWTMLVVFAK